MVSLRRLIGLFLLGFLIFPVLAVLAVLAVRPAVARAEVSNSGVWQGLMLQGKFSQNWGWYFENQLRLNDGWDYGASPSTSAASLKVRGNRLLLRPALRWMPTGDPHLQFAVGYAWVPNLSPLRSEGRAWEQVQYQIGDYHSEWATLWRLRLEQRQIELADGMAHRVRAMARVHRLFPDSSWGAVLWDEFFWNLNSVKKGPVSGFDQNRVFIGPMIQASPSTRVEVGYLNDFIGKGAAASSAMAHLFATYVTVDFP